jgi:hypothetical protein
MSKYDRYLARQDVFAQLSKAEVKKKHVDLLEDESDLDEPTRKRKAQEKIDLAKAREAKRLEKLQQQQKEEQEAAEEASGSKKSSIKKRKAVEDDGDEDDDDDDDDDNNNTDDVGGSQKQQQQEVKKKLQPVDKLLARIERIDTQIKNLKTSAIDRVLTL